MSDTVSVQRRMGELNVSPQFDSYSKVIIHVDEENAYEYGTDTGRTLEITNPFGSLQMCQDILARLQGYQYQPYEASEALIDPAAEVGDAINSPLIYGGIYSRSKTFGRLMKTDVSAPQDEELNHEYQFETPEQREFHRETDTLRASLMVTNESITAEVARATAAEGNLSSRLTQQADQIAAKVSQTGGNNSSFGWTLTASGFSLYSGNNEVLKCDSSGLTVAGNVAGTSGTIGGFTISASALYTNNMSTISSTQTNGVHLSSQGIKLGQNFMVDSAGNVTANNMVLNGTLNLGGTVITAATLAARTNSAYASTSAGGYCNTGAQFGYDFNNQFIYDSNLGSIRYRGSQFYANEIIANVGLRGNLYVTNSGGGGGAYRMPYYTSTRVLTGGYVDISYQTSTFTAWQFYPTYTTIKYLSAAGI